MPSLENVVVVKPEAFSEPQFEVVCVVLECRAQWPFNVKGINPYSFRGLNLGKVAVFMH
jgi:hypothetical protein